MKGGEKNMNAANLLVTAKPAATQKASQSGPSLNNQKSSEQTNSFEKLLNGEMSKTENPGTVQKQAVQSLSEEPEQPQDLLDSEELLEAVEKLLELLPIEEGFINPELLQSPEVAALLNQMPAQVQQLLTGFIQSGQSFEQLLQQTKTGSQEQLGLILLTLYQLEQKNQLPEQFNQLKLSDFVKVLQKQLNEVFKVEIPELSNNPVLLLTKLAETLEKKHTVSNQVPLETTNKLELRQIIQRVLYSSSSNDNAGEEQTAPKEMNTQAAASPELQTRSTVNEDVFDQLVASSIKDSGTVNRIQQYVLNVGQSAGSALPEDQIMEQLNNIMKQSKFSTSLNGSSQLMIKLNPAHLGSLTIKLTETNGEMIARIVASSATAKEVIESNLNTLKHVFTTQNINVEKFEIQYQGDGQFESAHKEGSRQGDQSKQKHEDTLKQNSNEDDSTETNSFKDELFNIMI